MGREERHLQRVLGRLPPRQSEREFVCWPVPLPRREGCVCVCVYSGG